LEIVPEICLDFLFLYLKEIAALNLNISTTLSCGDIDALSGMVELQIMVETQE